DQLHIVTNILFFSPSAHHRDLHSFPTRRSSDLVPVPKVVGLTEADAKAQIDSAGLKPQATTPQTGLGCTKGQVTKTDPEAGKAVAKGSTVSYTVCGGPKQVPVPNVVGATCDGATNQLKSAGLVAKC